MRSRVGFAGTIGLGALVVGLLLLFLTSGTISASGLVVAILAVAFLVADQLPAGLMGGGFVGTRRFRARERGPDPEYIERAAEPSEEAWRREQARYHDRYVGDDPHR